MQCLGRSLAESKHEETTYPAVALEQATAVLLLIRPLMQNPFPLWKGLPKRRKELGPVLLGVQGFFCLRPSWGVQGVYCSRPRALISAARSLLKVLGMIPRLPK